MRTLAWFLSLALLLIGADLAVGRARPDRAPRQSPIMDGNGGNPTPPPCTQNCGP